MLTLARLAAIVALMLWPAAAIANVPPPEEDQPTAPTTQPTDPNAPVINDAPPAASDQPTPPTNPVGDAPPEAVQQPAAAPADAPTDAAAPTADAPAASAGPSTGLIIGVGAVIIFLVIGGAMWFMRT